MTYQPRLRARRTLCILDGPSAWRQLEVRFDGGTLSTFVHSDGTWGVYDTIEGTTYSIRLREVNFVAGQDGIMFGVTETKRDAFYGVL